MAKYMTRQRKTLTDFLLLHADEDLSARQISLALSGDGISLSAVYRNLSELEEEGKVHRTSKGGSRDVFYRYTDANECRRHLHLSCSECGRTFHMPVEVTDRLISAVEQNTEFQIDRTGTVLYGLCKNCQKKHDGETLE